MANARVELGKAAGKELYQMFKAFKGGSIKVQGEITQSGAKAVREGGLERLVSGLERPSFRVSGGVEERAANFDVAILNGEEHVLSAKGEAVVPENAEGFFEYLGKLIGMGKSKAEPIRQITAEVKPKELTNIDKTKVATNEIWQRVKEFDIKEASKPERVLESYKHAVKEAKEMGIDISDIVKKLEDIQKA